MDSSDTAQLFVLLFLILLSAFFSSAETALTTVNKMRIRTLTDEGKKSAKRVARLLEEPGKMLSAILIGNNIVNLSASSMTTTLTLSLCQKAGLGENTALATSIATGLLTLVILIFGEITPKTIAQVYSEKTALFYSKIILLITCILTPVIFILNQFSKLILMLFHLDPNHKDSPITENELRTIVDVSHEEGVLESEERNMITNVVDFKDAYAKDVMCPRIDMEYVDLTLNYDDLIKAFAKEKFTRMPVFDEEHENVIGIINLKDVFFYDGEKENFSITDILREAFFTYEFKKTSDLMIEMRKASMSMAIVLDEYGVTAGILTMEDLLEEIVGDIRDEYDEDEEENIQKIGPYEYMVLGTAKLDDINEALSLNIESDDYDSIAGHIINLLEHFPKPGESILEGNIKYTVKSMDKNRIEKILITVLKPEAVEPQDTEEKH